MALSNERLYENAIDQEYCGWVCPYPFTAKRFEHLGSFQEAQAHAANCHRLSKGDYTDPALRNLYLSAVELQLDGYPSLAAVKFKKLTETDFLNSARHLEECERAMASAEAVQSQDGPALAVPDLEEQDCSNDDETDQYLDAYNSQTHRSDTPSFTGWVRTAFFAVAAACFAFGALAGVILGTFLH